MMATRCWLSLVPLSTSGLHPWVFYSFIVFSEVFSALPSIASVIQGPSAEGLNLSHIASLTVHFPSSLFHDLQSLGTTKVLSHCLQRLLLPRSTTWLDRPIRLPPNCPVYPRHLRDSLEVFPVLLGSRFSTVSLSTFCCVVMVTPR